MKSTRSGLRAIERWQTIWALALFAYVGLAAFFGVAFGQGQMATLGIVLNAAFVTIVWVILLAVFMVFVASVTYLVTRNWYPAATMGLTITTMIIVLPSGCMMIALL